MRYRVFQPPYGMRLARDLAAAALLLWIADAVLRTVAMDRPDPLIWALASSPYSRLLAVAQFLIVFPFLAYVGVALRSML